MPKPPHPLEHHLLGGNRIPSSRSEHSPSTFSPWKDQRLPARHPVACPLPFPSPQPAVSGAPAGPWQDPRVRLSHCSGPPAWKACSPTARQLPPFSARLGCRESPAAGHVATSSSRPVLLLGSSQSCGLLFNVSSCFSISKAYPRPRPPDICL